MRNSIVIAGIAALALGISANTHAASIDEELYTDDDLSIVMVGEDHDTYSSNVARFAAFSPRSGIDEDLYPDDDLDIVNIGSNPR